MGKFTILLFVNRPNNKNNRVHDLARSANKDLCTGQIVTVDRSGGYTSRAHCLVYVHRPGDQQHIGRNIGLFQKPKSDRKSQLGSQSGLGRLYNGVRNHVLCGIRDGGSVDVTNCISCVFLVI